jgi:hypothetical protein
MRAAKAHSNRIAFFSFKPQAKVKANKPKIISKGQPIGEGARIK